MVNEPGSTDGGRRQVRVCECACFHVLCYVACRCCMSPNKFELSPSAAPTPCSSQQQQAAAAEKYLCSQQQTSSKPAVYIIMYL